MGYISIIAGVISVIAGLIPFVFPGLFGIIPIFLGLFLLKAGRKATDFLREANDANIEEMMDYLAKYFKLQGVYTIVMLALFILFVIVTVILMIAGVTAVGDAWIH
jgi:cadmium resistance protein CadD (predicted permease)